MAEGRNDLAALSTAAVQTGLRFAGWYQRQVLAAVGSLLKPATSAVVPPAEGPVVQDRDQQPLDARMRRLLDRALEQTPVDGKSELFHLFLDRMVPDEARILGALSDGSRSPLVTIHARTRTGGAGEAVLENASLIGKMANVSLPSMTPTYVSHLLALGLVETGPEDPELRDDYQILSADSDVMRAMKNSARGPIAPRVERLTLRISSLGRDLWEACFPPDDPPT
jgi:hypothetical protein